MLLSAELAAQTKFHNYQPLINRGRVRWLHRGRTQPEFKTSNSLYILLHQLQCIAMLLLQSKRYISYITAPTGTSCQHSTSRGKISHIQPINSHIFFIPLKNPVSSHPMFEKRRYLQKKNFLFQCRKLRILFQNSSPIFTFRALSVDKRHMSIYANIYRDFEH